MKTTKQLLDGLYQLLDVPEADYSVWRLRPSSLSQGLAYNLFSAYDHLLCLQPTDIDDGTSCGVARIVCGHIWEHRYFELYPDLTPHVVLTYQTPGFTIRGTCDFIHTDEESGEIAVVDTKCVNDKVFNDFKYQPDLNHHYVKQVQYYIEMLRSSLPNGERRTINGSLALLSRHFLSVNPDNHFCFEAFTPEQWQQELTKVATLSKAVQRMQDAKNNAPLLLEKFDLLVNAVLAGKLLLHPYNCYTSWGKRLFNWQAGKPVSKKPKNFEKYITQLHTAMNTLEAKYDIG
jgi:hypothetical protein